jgi:hypothetical protein
MNTENNVVSMENVVIRNIEEAIVASLENRTHWVAPHVMTNAADRVNAQNVNVYGVIDRMVQEGTLEKSFQTVTDKFNRAVHLPLYRLTPSFRL